MDEHEIRAPYDANSGKNCDPNKPPQSIPTDAQRNPDSEPPKEEKHDSNTGPKSMLHLSAWQVVKGWWEDPFRIRPNSAELLTVFITIVIAFIGAQQACIYKKQLDVMSGQLTLMEAQTRPWIGTVGDVEFGDGTITSNPAKASVNFKLKLRNYGPSPAVFASRGEFEIVPAPQAIPRFWFFEKFKMCDKADRTFDQSNLWKHFYIVYPGEEGAVIQAFEAQTGSLPFRHPEGYPNDPILIGCLAYQGPDRKLYHLQLMYNLWIHIESKTQERKIIAMNLVNVSPH